MSSSEEVLLIVKHVRNKKCEGTLYMMGERMAWMQNAKDSFTVSHSYADIRAQKISPDTKEKVQLQVVLHDGGANTFHLCNPQSKDAQRADRDAVKEMLQQLLPKFRRKVNSELEEKNRLLQQDPELFQLYKDLVVSGVITSEQFWTNRTSRQLGAVSIGETQDVGVSAAFLADIKPQTDGCNGLRYNLTADIIQSIFRTYPAVKARHVEYVPTQLTEQEFWTRFFQSHYFHRDRIIFNSKDLFADCAKADDQDLQREIDRPSADPLVDLTRMQDVVMDEGYGSQVNTPATAVNLCNSSLIKRFNQHSTMVLKACDSSRQTTDGGGGAGVGNGTEEGEPSTKRMRITEKLTYTDLDPGATPQPCASSLHLAHPDRYLHGLTTTMTATGLDYEPTTATGCGNGDAFRASRAVATEMLSWQPRLTQVLTNTAAASILGELSPGGALMQSSSQQQLHQLVSRDLQQEVKQLYSALCELLRHFWSCFPPSSKNLEEKVVKMQGSLQRFQVAKLLPLKHRLQVQHYTINLVGHMEDLLECAHKKFNTWHARKLSKKA